MVRSTIVFSMHIRLDSNIEVFLLKLPTALDCVTYQFVD